MAGNEREVRELIERSRGYSTNGSAAYKTQPEPQRYEPVRRKKQQGTAVKKKPAARNVLQNLPTLVKAELIGTAVVVTVMMIALAVLQVMVGTVTAENNAMIRDINAIEAQSHLLAEKVDANVDLDSVYEAAEREGMVLSKTVIAEP